MIDYYLHKKCCLTSPVPRQIENIRCKGCVWLDLKQNKCVFSLDYKGNILNEDFKNRINNVNIIQQQKLSEPFRRFIL